MAKQPGQNPTGGSDGSASCHGRIPDGEAVRAAFPRDRLFPDVVQALEEAARAGEAAWILACSGGADSVASTLATWGHFPQMRNRMLVAHLNHGLRGICSEGDAAFAEHLARDLGLAFRGELLAWASQEPVNEEALREARLGFFRDCPLGWEAPHRFVLSGHHLNDVIETQVMRLARGASSAGLAAPRPVSFHPPHLTLLRPLLDWPKADILLALQKLRMTWREDASNQEGLFFRNRVRNSVIPALEKAAPGKPLEGSRLTRKWMEEDADALSAWVTSLYPVFPARGAPLDLKPLSGKPKALWRRTVLRWLDLQDLGNTFSSEGIEQVLNSLIQDKTRGHRRWSAGPDRFIEVDGGVLHAVEGERATSWSSLAVAPGDPHLLEAGGRFKVLEVAVDNVLRDKILKGESDCEKECYLDLQSLRNAGYTGSLLLRQWSHGDRYHPLGAPGSQKLQDSFTDRGIPRLERNRRPLVCLQKNNDILWCPGLLPADQHKVTTTTDKALWLTYQDTSTAS